MLAIKSKNLLTVQITGLVNAETEFPVLDTKGVDTIIFDFNKLDGFNSYGVKGWISYLQKIDPEMKIIFRNCKRIVVDQMNMVTNFLPANAVVESFYVPYHCPKCQKFFNSLYEHGKQYENKIVSQLTQVVCDKCKIDAEMDVIKAKYFNFLTR
ncbi:MAG: hypothetical protein IPM57_08305 [Oligoflexia bacterium]|nr:hypothetical protein [Oligoflexia bacterium]